MKKNEHHQNEIKIVGLSIRTNNQNEMNPETAQIAQLVSKYFHQNIANKILHRKNPNTTIAVYTDYESNEHGDYTYFIGEAVSSFEQTDTDLDSCIIPAGNFFKLTTRTGKMPDVVIEAWQKIWSISPDNFGGKRLYQADFEVYDERAIDPTQTCVDIYIGIES